MHTSGMVTGDDIRRLHCYTEHGVENDAAARAMERHWGELISLATDDLASEAFQASYMRLTERYHEGEDYPRQFRAMFYNTLKELKLLRYNRININDRDANIIENQEET